MIIKLGIENNYYNSIRTLYKMVEKQLKSYLIKNRKVFDKMKL
ncbi:hypothetical protein [Streptobacillus notomytis]|nr:hypothetical protein [Streptobacillus notomytis]